MGFELKNLVFCFEMKRISIKAALNKHTRTHTHTQKKKTQGKKKADWTQWRIFVLFCIDLGPKPWGIGVYCVIVLEVCPFLRPYPHDALYPCVYFVKIAPSCPDHTPHVFQDHKVPCNSICLAVISEQCPDCTLQFNCCAQMCTLSWFHNFTPTITHMVTCTSYIRARYNHNHNVLPELATKHCVILCFVLISEFCPNPNM